MPDAITELDLFAPVPDLEELLFGRSTGLAAGDSTELDWGTSQILPDSVEERGTSSQMMELEEDDLGLDFGQDMTAPSIEIGRRAETPRRTEALFDDDLGLDLGLGDTTIGAEPAIFGDDDINVGDLSAVNRNKAALADATRRHRESMSPLSDLGDAQADDLERTFQLGDVEEDDNAAQAPQRAPKRRKVLAMDADTELAASQVKNQPRDRTAILLPHANKLPRDPVILALLTMQRNGAFVSSVLGDGLSQRGLAPELRGVLSLEVVRRAGDLKRKRPLSLAGPTSPTAQQDDFFGGDDDFGFAQDDAPLTPGGPGFDETTIAPVAPADSGPVSLATAHTVHLLRARFADNPDEPNVGPPSPASRKARSVAFADLCPPSRTSRTDATKLFFETLVLATKDAVRVQQEPGQGLGAELRIRAKRGLWGAWAEAGVANDEDDEEMEEVARAEGVPVEVL